MALAVEGRAVGFAGIVLVAADERQVGQPPHAHALLAHGRGQVVSVVGHGQVVDHARQAGEAPHQTAGLALENIDAVGFVPTVAGPAGAKDVAAVGAHGHAVEPALVVVADGRTQHAQLFAGADVPDTAGLVVRGRGQVAAQAVHGDAFDKRRVHAGFDAQDRLGGRRSGGGVAVGGKEQENGQQADAKAHGDHSSPVSGRGAFFSPPDGPVKCPLQSPGPKSPPFGPSRIPKQLMNSVPAPLSRRSRRGSSPPGRRRLLPLLPLLPPYALPQLARSTR